MLHDDEDVERTPADTSRDSIPYAFDGTGNYQSNYYDSSSSVVVADGDGVRQLAVATQNNETTMATGGADDTAAVRPSSTMSKSFLAEIRR